MAKPQDDIALDIFVSKRNDLVALANSVVRNHAIAEELVQESWLKWSTKTYPDDRAHSIFKRIVMNLARDWHRKQRRDWANLETFSLFFDNTPDTEHIVIGRQDLIIALRAMQQLPPKVLHAFRLNRVDGLTYAQIGKKMGISTTAAYYLVADALVRVTLTAER